MKKFASAVVLAALTASMGAYAALPTGSAPFQVNVPNLNSGFEFNLTGFYLRPNSGNLDYANVSSTAGSITHTEQNTVEPGAKPGFSLGAGYLFPNSSNDVQLNWTHLYAKATASVLGASVNPPQATTVDATAANAQAKFRYNAVDLDAGQYVNFGTRLQMRLFGGLRYANVKRDLGSNFTGVSQINTNSTTFNQDATMWGIGPRLGLAAQYHLSGHFGAVANIAATLLYAHVKHDAETIQTVYETGTSITNILPSSVSRVVPGLDGKLGLDYSYVFGASVLNVEGGYQAIHYFNAIDSVSGAGVAYTTSTTRSTSGVSFDGPYLSLSLKV